MSEHAITPRTYLAVFTALVVLTAATVKIASYDLGEPEVAFGVRVPLNTIAALAIALLKATLVVLYFMHVRHSPRLIWVVVGAAVVFLLILLGFPAIDYWSRDWLGNPGT
jgi:cytochrome c oxidase subunit 4